MNTKKVADLLSEIEKAQEAVTVLETEAAGVAKKIAAEGRRIMALKRALAEELGELVVPKPARPGAVGRQSGVAAAVLAALADGQPRATEAIAAALATAGVKPANLSVSLSVLARKGSLVRVSRGVYRRQPGPTP